VVLYGWFGFVWGDGCNAVGEGAQRSLLGMEKVFTDGEFEMLKPLGVGTFGRKGRYIVQSGTKELDRLCV